MRNNDKQREVAYEAPKVECIEVCLEYGIAQSSGTIRDLENEEWY